MTKKSGREKEVNKELTQMKIASIKKGDLGYRDDERRGR